MAHGVDSSVQTYAYSSTTPVSADECAVLRAQYPNRARDPKLCMVSSTVRVVVHSAALARSTAAGPYVICTDNCGGGCVSVSPPSEVTIYYQAVGPAQSYRAEEDADFSGDHCNPPVVNWQHCYPAFVAWGTSMSTQWCDNYTNSAGDRYASGGFLVSSFGGAQYTEQVYIKMYECMCQWAYWGSPYS